MPELKLFIQKATISPPSSWGSAKGKFDNPTIDIYNSGSVFITSYPVTQSDSIFITASVNPNPPYEFHIKYDQHTENDWLVVNEAYITWNIKPELDEEVDINYKYRLFISSSNEPDIITYNPSSYNGKSTDKWSLTVRDPELPISPIFNINGFWGFYNDGINSYDAGNDSYNKIELLSSEAKTFYNKDYYQNHLEYIPSKNVRFKGGYEPQETQFPNVIDGWYLDEKDEIRFENSESKTYVIKHIFPTYDVNNTLTKLIIEVDSFIPKRTNLDFFLIRRWKQNKNILSINEIFPYSNNLPSMSLAPSTSGFIFPEYPINDIANNPDKIIRDLIDKKIIE